MNSLFNPGETGDVFNLEIRKTPDKPDFKIRKGLNNLPLATLIRERTYNLNPNIFKTINNLYVKIGKRINNFYFAKQFNTIASAVISNGSTRSGECRQGNESEQNKYNTFHNIDIKVK